MHYKDGSEAKANDLIVCQNNFSPNTGTEIVGFLMSGNAGSETCNGVIYPLAIRRKSDLGWSPWAPAQFNYDCTVTMKDCMKLDTWPTNVEGGPVPTGNPGGKS